MKDKNINLRIYDVGSSLDASEKNKVNKSNEYQQKFASTRQLGQINSEPRAPGTFGQKHPSGAASNANLMPRSYQVSSAMSDNYNKESRFNVHDSTGYKGEPEGDSKYPGSIDDNFKLEDDDEYDDDQFF